MTPGFLQPAAKTERGRSTEGYLPLSSVGSVTHLICQVKKGDAAAAQELFARYSRRLLGLARAKLHGKDLRIADEEDVVSAALAGFFLGAERGQFTQLHDRDDLWHLLAKITVYKARRLVDEQERQKRRPGGARRSTPLQTLPGTPLADGSIGQIADPKPPADFEVLANQAVEHLLSRLQNARLRSIAVWKWEGYSNEEIASMLDCSSRTIARKLTLIRTIWSKEDASRAPAHLADGAN
jgi:DNA-directed RNA polymerase specialized sigma24 family protein